MSLSDFPRRRWKRNSSRRGRDGSSMVSRDIAASVAFARRSTTPCQWKAWKHSVTSWSNFVIVTGAEMHRIVVLDKLAPEGLALLKKAQNIAFEVRIGLKGDEL